MNKKLNQVTRKADFNFSLKYESFIDKKIRTPVGLIIFYIQEF